MALCHTVLASKDSKFQYQSSSVDEKAQIIACRCFGFDLQFNDKNTCKVNSLGEHKFYEILSINGFSHSRNLFSVLIRNVNEATYTKLGDYEGEILVKEVSSLMNQWSMHYNGKCNEAPETSGAVLLVKGPIEGLEKKCFNINNQIKEKVENLKKQGLKVICFARRFIN